MTGTIGSPEDWPDEEDSHLPEAERANLAEKLVVWMERRGLIPPAEPGTVPPDVIPPEWLDEPGEDTDDER